MGPAPQELSVKKLPACLPVAVTEGKPVVDIGK
jgi:hypothetical protein